jgi:hypothetical protein
MIQGNSRTIPAHNISGRRSEYGNYGDEDEDDDYADHRQGSLRSNVDDGGKHQAAAASSRPNSARKPVANMNSSQFGKAATMAAQSRAQAQSAVRPSTTNSVDLTTSSRPSRGTVKQDPNSNRGSSSLTATNTSASWARTSRSSASRYSSAGSDNDNEEGRTPEVDSYDQQMAHFGTARGVAASPQTKAPSRNQSSALSISTGRSGSFNNSSAAPDTTNGGGSVDSGSNRVEEVLPDGTRHITYRNGTRKNVFLNGDSEVLFVNGDSKHVTAASGVVVYYYDQAQTTHTTFPDGKEVYEFPNKQVRRYHVLKISDNSTD